LACGQSVFQKTLLCLRASSRATRRSIIDQTGRHKKPPCPSCHLKTNSPKSCTQMGPCNRAGLNDSSLVNTLPITKKNKSTVVTEAHKECTYAAYAPANLLQKANSGSNWRLSSERVGGTEFSFMCHVPGTRGISPGYFCPSRASSQCFSQASGASRSQHRLSSFLLTKYGSRSCNAVGCANTNCHRPTNNSTCRSLKGLCCGPLFLFLLSISLVNTLPKN